MSDYRFGVTILGRKIGTCSAVDDESDNILQFGFWDFEPTLPNKMDIVGTNYLVIDFETGVVRALDIRDDVELETARYHLNDF